MTVLKNKSLVLACMASLALGACFGGDSTSDRAGPGDTGSNPGTPGGGNNGGGGTPGGLAALGLRGRVRLYDVVLRGRGEAGYGGDDDGAADAKPGEGLVGQRLGRVVGHSGLR